DSRSSVFLLRSSLLRRFQGIKSVCDHSRGCYCQGDAGDSEHCLRKTAHSRWIGRRRAQGSPINSEWRSSCWLLRYRDGRS
ncbi:hypothetical protein PFISCL1PPCAC_28466, partial [Pristionchus fissidentatus]